MSQAPVPTYRVEYEPSRGSWLLIGLVGAKGRLRYTTARDAADYACWDARDTGGTIDVFDQQGQLFRKISVKADDSVAAGLVLPSVQTEIITATVTAIDASKPCIYGHFKGVLGNLKKAVRANENPATH